MVAENIRFIDSIHNAESQTPLEILYHSSSEAMTCPINVTNGRCSTGFRHRLGSERSPNSSPPKKQTTWRSPVCSFRATAETHNVADLRREPAGEVGASRKKVTAGPGRGRSSCARLPESSELRMANARSQKGEPEAPKTVPTTNERQFLPRPAAKHPPT